MTELQSFPAALYPGQWYPGDSTHIEPDDVANLTESASTGSDLTEFPVTGGIPEFVPFVVGGSPTTINLTEKPV